MKLKRIRGAPAIITGVVLALVCGLWALKIDFFERLEKATYDARVSLAWNHPRLLLVKPSPLATNLAFVSIEESSVRMVKDGELGYHFGLLWPRQVFGRLVNELSAQGAKAVGFDVLFNELRPDHAAVLLEDGHSHEESDANFAREMWQAGNVILAAEPGMELPGLFATNALAVGDIYIEKDSDGVLRKARVFNYNRRWHPWFHKFFADDPEIRADLDHARLLPGKILLPQFGVTNDIEIPVDAATNVLAADLFGDRLPPGTPAKVRAFTDERLWHLGIVLAARQLKLDLDHAIVDLPGRKVTLVGERGLTRVIPVDANGCFLVNWQIPYNSPSLTRRPIEDLLRQNLARQAGQTNDLDQDFSGKLVVVGNAMQGNNLTDRGATPLENNTLLASIHWNVANSVISNQFIRRASLGETLGWLVFLGLLTAWVTCRLRALLASLVVLLLMLGYTVLTAFVFAHYRLWLPLVFPLMGAILLEHVSLITYRIVFEEGERRHVRSVFSRIVSPDIVQELLQAKNLSLGGERREITIFFADVRGFTTFTDQIQEQIAEHLRTHRVDPEEAEKFYEATARETLATVNLYLSAVAEAVKKHNGTLDKYIGDCVMAFWNAPTPNEKHATAAVLAAIEAQRAIQKLNETRLAENPARETENRARLDAHLPPWPLHVALELGTGIHTGMVTVGLMGSARHILNYTVFGREVNLASRLEGISGSGHIIISAATYQHLSRHLPALALTCSERPPVVVKGIRHPVNIYEVPWK